jgi:hypothetical protein
LCSYGITVIDDILNITYRTARTSNSNDTTTKNSISNIDSITSEFITTDIAGTGKYSATSDTIGVYCVVLEYVIGNITTGINNITIDKVKISSIIIRISSRSNCITGKCIAGNSTNGTTNDATTIKVFTNSNCIIGEFVISNITNISFTCSNYSTTINSGSSYFITVN